MNDALLETICVNGTRPPYKRPAWVLGHVGNEGQERRRAQTATPRQRNSHASTDSQRPKSTPCRLNVSFRGSSPARCARWKQVHSAKQRSSLEEQHNNRDIAIQQLHQQLDDLTLMLEEDRLNYKLNLRKVKEGHQTYVEKIQQEHTEHIKSVEADRDEEMKRLKHSFERQLEEEKENAEIEKEFMLTYARGTVATEMDFKWKTKMKELRSEHDRRTADELSKQRKEFLHEKTKEIEGLNKEFQRQIQILVEDHRKEVDNLMEKFAECVQDSEQLKSVLLEMKVPRVEEVDNRYSMKIQNLMSDNTDLRRHYVKKCEQVFKLRTDQDIQLESSLRNAKSSLQAVILARARCGVSLTAQRTGGLPAGNSESIMCRKRPVSAPLTRDEVRKAELSTDVIKDENSRTEKSTIPGYKWESTRTRPHTSHHGSTFSPRTLKPSSVRGVRESLVPTLVNFSGQDLENL
ncbi:PREDICTED: trichohyalin-like [Acropora digitifera]|uniref:trichohyalin-like n=1 Tax=Acropora digitifera TaxID=70779 RepID=UPI00077AE498|nr:PREDICTED: trichohyalin-like [Acropora digitifera]